MACRAARNKLNPNILVVTNPELGILHRQPAKLQARYHLAKEILPSSLFIRYNSRMEITRRQKEVLDFLSGFTQKNGYSPSYEEIAGGLGLSSLATVHKHITNLQSKGLLQRAHNRSRSIDVLPVRSGKKGSDRLPLLGRIAAGQPVEAIETAESISLNDIFSTQFAFYSLQFPHGYHAAAKRGS
jgi:hypothetical protein